MSNYVENRMLGIAAPLVDSKKGDFVNRSKCAGELAKNRLKEFATDAVIIGGTTAGAAYVAKSPTAARALQKVLSPIAKAVKQFYGPAFKKIASSKIVQNFKKLPSLNKGAVVVVAGLGLAALSAVGAKHIYKAGQIDQKYTDMAQMRKHQEEVLA